MLLIIIIFNKSQKVENILFCNKNVIKIYKL